MSVLKLIIKDFRANWIYQGLLIGVLFAMSTGFMYLSLSEFGNVEGSSGNKTPVESELYILVIIMSSMVASLLFLLIDDTYRTAEVFASLPVTRTQLVLARYGAAIVQICIALLIHILAIQFVVFMMGSSLHSGLEIFFKPVLWFVILLIAILFISFSYPFYFKFGLIKGVLTFSVLPLILLILTVLGLEFFNTYWIVSNYIEPIWDAFFAQDGRMILAESIGTYLFIVITSIKLSIWLYKNKDI